MFESYVPVIENDVDLLLTGNSEPQNSDCQPFFIAVSDATEAFLKHLWETPCGMVLLGKVSVQEFKAIIKVGRMTYDSFTMKS